MFQLFFYLILLLSLSLDCTYIKVIIFSKAVIRKSRFQIKIYF
jgi:hypothetical protein